MTKKERAALFGSLGMCQSDVKAVKFSDQKATKFSEAVEYILNRGVRIGGIELDLDDVRAIYYTLLGHDLPESKLRDELKNVCEFIDINYPEDILKAEVWLSR